MSMKRLAVVSAVHTAQLLSNSSSAGNSTTSGHKESGHHGYGMSSGRVGRFDTDLHGNVNVLLGGVMLGSVITVVFLVCYCCHRSMRKNRPHEYSQYWRAEPDVHSLEVFTMDSHAMCYDRSGLSLSGHHMAADELSIVTIPGGIPVGLSGSLTPRPMTPGPPPAYESLVFKSGLGSSPSDKKPADTAGRILPVPLESEHAGLQQQHRRTSVKEEESRRDDEGLPSYEAALKLEAQGYV